MVFRLDCMLDNDSPSHSGIAAEHILVNLSQDPQAFLVSDFVKCIISLKPPHSFITFTERNALQTAAIVAEDGLLGAVDELLRPIERPPTLMSLRTLRVALAIVERELSDLGEYEVVQEFWKEGPCSLICLLADIFVVISEDLGSHFTLKPPPSVPSGLVTQLFYASGDLLRVILRLFPSFPVPSRVVRLLTTNIANLFVYTDTADMLYNQSSPTCKAAQDIRQLCIDITRALGNPHLSSEDGKLGGQVVLRTLLDHGLQVENKDPTHHLLQVFCLIDYLLPIPGLPSTDLWTLKVFPSLLHNLWSFFRSLDTENKAHFVRRLVGLDTADVGIGDWLIQEELKDTVNALKELENPGLDVNTRFMRQYQVSLSLRFLLDLIGRSSEVSRWATTCLTTGPDTIHILATCLWSFLALDIMSVNLARLVQIVGSEYENMGKELHYPLALTLLRSSWSVELSPIELTSLLSTSRILFTSVPIEDLDMDRLAADIGAILSILDASPHLLGDEVPVGIVLLLDWFVHTAVIDRPEPSKLHGISSTSFTSLCDRLHEFLDDDGQAMLSASKDAINPVGFANDGSPTRMPTFLPESIDLSIQELEEVLRPKILPIPSTPPHNALSQDILSLVTISPPTALIRSPLVSTTGLTKTYSNNDFRQLRQTPSARQNTSRLPSMHVDVGSSLIDSR